MADNKPTFHHMNVSLRPYSTLTSLRTNSSNQSSQSQRILWLLEELGIEYNLVLHYRNPPNHPKAPFRSPPSLIETGPYGKAPLLITGDKDGKRYIPESSAIATYLIRTFDTTDKFGLKNGDWVRDEVITSLSQTNLNRGIGMLLMLDFGAIRNGQRPMGKRFDGPEQRAQLADLERELVEGPKGGFFMGEHPGRADIMLEYPISSIKHRNWVDLPKEFPKLNEWLQRVYDRPAFKRSLEKGNGYDMSCFPKTPRL
ncbi:gst3 [Hyphodiscus hymeniophilus]|uniref:Gst3 n=1 Tax=Hyphodiscus hymeniophilus TaxID=353542 RepID=A0A9P6VG07_9HELO|nr:gst3 [Hyphodiscus hymeniophilus]